MIKFLTLLCVAFWIAAPSPAHAVKKPTRDCAAAPETCLPYTDVGLFAVLLPTQANGRDACRIGLMRHGGATNAPAGRPDAVSEIFLFFNVDTKVYLQSGQGILLSFEFPDASAHRLIATWSTAPVPCATLSHLQVLTAKCRLLGALLPKLDSKFDYKSDACIEGLPRRLDFVPVAGPNAIGPGLSP